MVKKRNARASSPLLPVEGGFKRSNILREKKPFYTVGT
jgi:hypothetical protein